MAEFDARIKNKRDTEANWTAANPVLLNGEIIFVDTDSGLRRKVGDGSSTYSQLSFDDEVATVDSAGLMSALDKEAFNEYVFEAYTLTTRTSETLTTDDGEEIIAYKVKSGDTTYTLSKKNDNIVLTGSDGSVSAVLATDTTYSEATDSESGLMSAEDKLKLDGIAEGATANTGTITAITTTAPLSGSGTSGSVAISHKSSGATAGSYGDSSAQTPAFGGTFKVLYETVDAYGHVTAISAHTVTMPSAAATTSAAGLMSAADKTNLTSLISRISELESQVEDILAILENVLLVD